MLNYIRCFLSGLFACSSAGIANAQSTYVISPDEPDAIQVLIDEFIQDGDVIQLSVGTYVLPDTIDSRGKAFTLRGMLDKAGEPASVLDGSGVRRVLICQSGETAATQFERLVIRNGSTRNSFPYFSDFPRMGGGMLNIWGSSPTVSECVFQNNSVGTTGDSRGGGMCNFQGSCPSVFNCRFEENLAFRGGGMFNDSSDPTISDCVFFSNLATDDYYDNGGTICPQQGDCGTANDSPGCNDQACCVNVCEADDYCCTVVWDDYCAGLALDLCFVEGGGGGGGLFNTSSSPALINCIFDSNVAEYSNTVENGGGIYNRLGSNPSLIDCVFSGNRAGNGGGIFTHDGCSPSLVGCVFSDNVAIDSGGGMYALETGEPTLLECVFTRNDAYYGGGMAINGVNNRSTVLTNCVFIENHSQLNGGGLAAVGRCSPRFIECSFVANAAGYLPSGAIFLGLNSQLLGSVAFTSCVFDGNENGTIYSTTPGTAVLSDCVFTECCQVVPPWSFVDDGGNEYDSWCDDCRADVNCRDNAVNAADLGILIGSWGTNDPQCDINGDGTVSAADLGLLIGAWGPCQ